MRESKVSGLGSGAAGRPLRVLVIDDDEIAREALCMTLRAAGHQVSELGSAFGATRAIYEHNVDAVVLDVMMPDLGGDTLGRVLRENSKGKHLAIILVSSMPSEQLSKLASAAHADGTVYKADICQKLCHEVVQAWRHRTAELSLAAAASPTAC